jgi:uncharacterized lipoprotein YmbA
MRKSTICLFLILAFTLAGCGRSKNPEFYVLNPIPSQKPQGNTYKNLRIGIDKISVPASLEKPQVTINHSAHRVELQENSEWLEGLDKNITRIIVINLASYLPGALVNISPWDSFFRPNYHLEIKIIQCTMDDTGTSVLRADYILYQDEHLIGKRDFYHSEKTPVLTTENLVIGMNNNITRFTQDIAKYIEQNRRS